MKTCVTPDRADLSGREGIVAAEDPAAGHAGLSILEAGGNAVDATVATAFCTCVAKPGSATIAGSGFILVGEPNGDSHCVEFPPRAPQAAHPSMYRLESDPGSARILGVSMVADDANSTGPLAIGVPAAVAGLCAAHQRFGSLPLAKVIEPAVRLAADGIVVSPELTLSLLSVLPDIQADEELTRIFLDGRGLPLSDEPAYSAPFGVRQRVRQPDLADVLERVGHKGPETFYAGEIARELVAHLSDRGGILTLADLARYEPLTGRPLQVRMGETVLSTVTSPSGGWTVLQLLMAWRAAGADGDAPRDLHRRIELARHAFADRYHHMGDPAHCDVPLTRLLSDSYARQLASAVDDDRVVFAFPQDQEPWVRWANSASGASVGGLGDSAETAHISVVDRTGRVASCTLTAANSFGAKVMHRGVLFDDAMIWFNAAPGAVNSIGPWKRPLVNMAPLLATRADGATLAVGAPGGRRVPTAVAEVTHRWLRGEELADALMAPRFDASGREVLVSRRMPPELRAELEARGHPVRAVEDRDPLSSEFARPNAVDRQADRLCHGGVHPFSQGFVGSR